MKSFLVVSAALLALGVAGGSRAGVTFTSYGTALPTGETLITDFSSGAGLSNGTAYLVTGSTPGVTAAPAFSATTFDTHQYLSVPGGAGTTTLTFAPTDEVSVYIGSLDTYNTLTLGFGGSVPVAYTGSELGVVSGAADGNQTAANTNGRFVFTFSTPVSSLTFGSTSNAFEAADVGGGGAVPEPVSWAMLIVGMAGVGASLRNGRQRLSTRTA